MQKQPGTRARASPANAFCERFTNIGAILDLLPHGQKFTNTHCDCHCTASRRGLFPTVIWPLTWIDRNGIHFLSKTFAFLSSNLSMPPFILPFWKCEEGKSLIILGKADLLLPAMIRQSSHSRLERVHACHSSRLLHSASRQLLEKKAPKCLYDIRIRRPQNISRE